MKPSEELINYLGSKTVDQDTLPRMNSETVGVNVGTLRTIINILKFQLKEPVNAATRDALVYPRVDHKES